MYTQCPECLTIYKLAAAELAGGHGSVRCGHCAAVFDALRTLTDQLPPEPITQLEEIPGGGAPPQLSIPALATGVGDAARRIVRSGRAHGRASVA